MLTHAEIVEILNREVRSAEARLRDARQYVDAIKGEASLPQQDVNLRIANAIKEHAKARDALQRAVKRNVAFTLNGIIPEDLRGS